MKLTMIMFRLSLQITDDRKNVCSMDIGEEVDPEHTKILCNHLKSLLRERDGFVEVRKYSFIFLFSRSCHLRFVVLL